MSYRGDREMHDATCGDCGKQCQVPFEPRQDKPVYCGDCFQKHKPQNRGGGRFGGRGGSGGKECEVPFEPKGDKPVYCSECFQSHKRN